MNWPEGGGKVMRVEHIGDATLILADCMDIMRDMPDKAFDLAIVDPPYGLGFDKENPAMSAGLRTDGTQRVMRTWRTPKPKNYKNGNWDVRPPEGYFGELFRVSRYAIVWGGNHFDLPLSGGWIVWDKQVSMPSLSKAELAWTNCSNHIELFSFLWAGYRKGEPCSRIHPTQKPIALYKWLLSKYAKSGWKILDTHGGSGSSVVACLELGFSITWIEKDKDYFNAAFERIEKTYQQLSMPKEACGKEGGV